MMYTPSAEFTVGGLGPLFLLLLLLCLPFCFFMRGGENGWLVFTICVMLFIHPYAYYLRYVPFLWALPFVLCLSAPRQWGSYLLTVPILLGVINSCGIAYVSLWVAESHRSFIVETLTPHRGEYVLLDKTTFRVDGILDRFGIKQRFANPEETLLPNRYLFGTYRERYIPGRLSLASSIAFTADIPPLPTLPVILAEERSEPWTRMSEGIFLHVPEEGSAPGNQSVPKGFWNYSGRVKFFVRVLEKPVGDVELTLTARLREEDGAVVPQKMSVYANDRFIGEWTWDKPVSEEKTVTLPLEVLEKSHNSPMNLLILRFELSDAETNTAQEFSMLFEKMEFQATRR